MKSSRAMLLAALLFAVPAFASENQEASQSNTPATLNQENKPAEDTAGTPENKPTDKPADAQVANVADNATQAPKKDEAPAKEEAKEGLFATALKYGKMPFVAVLATAPDYIAQKTLGNIAAMECLKGGKLAEFLNNKWTGRSAVFGSAALITYLVWNATQSEDVDADDSDVMFE